MDGAGERPLPHDLLRLADPAWLVPAACAAPTPPAWVRETLEYTPWVVVRRAAHTSTHVPVGVRGGRRGQRWAAYVAREAVVETVRPDELLTAPARRDLPAFRAIAHLAGVARPRWAMTWGPGGSVGFELATGHPTAREDSDLDLVVRVPKPVSRARVTRLLDALALLPVRVDVQLQTPGGGLAAAEYSRTSGRVLVRGDAGPRLVTDPWDGLAGTEQR